MFDASDELLDDADLPSKSEWRNVPSSGSSVGDMNESQYPDAVALLQKIGDLGSDIPDADSQEIQALSKKLKQAMDNSDSIEVSNLSAEPDDILFYVQ